MKTKMHDEHLEQEPERPEQARAVPAAEEERHRERRERDQVHVLGHLEEAPAHAAVLGVVAGDELLLGLGQVERRAVRLGGAGDQEHDEARRLRDDVPPVVVLLSSTISASESDWP